MKRQPRKVYTTADGTAIFIYTGEKSKYDFRVKYHSPNAKREGRPGDRTPKHIHLIVDLYMKLVGNKALTMRLVDHLIESVIQRVEPAGAFPPALQVFSPEHVREFQELDKYGEYSAEFLLVVTELIMMQEKTNYPDGTLNLEVFQGFRNEEDIFTVVGKATLGRR